MSRLSAHIRSFSTEYSPPTSLDAAPSIPGELPTPSTLRYSDWPRFPNSLVGFLHEVTDSSGTERTPRHFWQRKLALFSQPVTIAYSHLGSFVRQNGHLGSLLSMNFLAPLS